MLSNLFCGPRLVAPAASRIGVREVRGPCLHTTSRRRSERRTGARRTIRVGDLTQHRDGLRKNYLSSSFVNFDTCGCKHTWALMQAWQLTCASRPTLRFKCSRLTHYMRWSKALYNVRLLSTVWRLIVGVVRLLAEGSEEQHQLSLLHVARFWCSFYAWNERIPFKYFAF